MRKQAVKKLLSSLIVVALLLSATPLDGFIVPCLFGTVARAATVVKEGSCGENGNNVTYYLYSDGKLVIEGTGNMADAGNSSKLFKNIDYATEIKSVEIKNGIAKIGKSAFENCSCITSVDIPDSVTSIGSNAFYNCTSLESITIGTGVTSIGNAAFSNTSYFSDGNNWIGGVFYIGNYLICAKNSIIGEYSIIPGTKIIADWAFFGAKNITKIIISEDVTNIGDYAFYACDNLTAVTISKSAKYIGVAAFAHCPKLESIAVADDNRFYSSDSNGILYNKSKTELIRYPVGSTRTSFVVPDSVKSIGYCSFEYGSNLESVFIGEGVEEIDGSAFEYCANLNTINIPDSVKSISVSAFAHCDALTEVIIGNGISNISEYAFSDCQKLEKVTIGDKALYLRESLFSGCTSLKTVIINGKLWQIKSSAFYGCDNLTDVYYKGSQADWDNISIESNNDCLMNAELHCWYGHVHTEQVIAGVAATCTESGISDGIYCPTCDSVVVEQKNVSPLGHSFGEWAVSTPATCTADGVETRTCSRCDHSETRAIAKNGHTEVIDSAVAPTCTATGLTEGKHCSVCDEVIVAQETVAALGHSFGEWAVSIPATCTADGVETHTCSRCNHSETRVIEKTGHTEVIDPEVAPTCTATGLTEGKHCSVCNEIIVAQQPVAALGHSFGEWAVSTPATCTADGVETRTCSRCDHSETRVIEKTGHTEVIDPAVTPTCTATGLTEGKHCSVCDEVIVAQETVAALGHSFGEWITVTEPTPDADGQKKRTCSACGKEDFESIPKLTLTGIEIATLPTNTTYTYKKAASTAGMKVFAKYSDGSKFDVSNEVNVTGLDTSSKGNHTATVEFGGKTATFNYTVKYAWWQWIIKIVLFGWLWY